MTSNSTESTTDQSSNWRAIAKRIRDLFKQEFGSNNELRHRLLGEVGGYHMNRNSLDQTLRAKGRGTRNVEDLIGGFARVFAVKLHCGRDDLSVAELEGAYVAYLRMGVPVPRPPIGASGAGNITAALPTGLVTALWSFDLWTPGQTTEGIRARFLDALGPDGASRVADLSREAIEAIGRGDFDEQQRLAEEAITLGKSAQTTPLAGEGLYLKAEALRLRADFEPDRARQRALRCEAEQFYGQAEDALRGDPRAIRGRARTVEVLGDLDSAFDLFDLAVSAVERRAATSDGQDHLSLAHERVRSLRHKLTCMAAMQDQAPLATTHARQRAVVIRDLIDRSEPDHRQALELFRDHSDWWRIEWFMAQVLHAKGWAAVGDASIAAKRLQWSLQMRLSMLPLSGALTPVELGNLHWWSGIAGKVRGVFEREQQLPLAELFDAINRGVDRATIHLLGAALLRSGEAPWSKD